MEHAEILVKAKSWMAGALYNDEGGAVVQRGCNYKLGYKVNRAHVDAVVNVGPSGELDAAWAGLAKAAWIGFL